MLLFLAWPLSVTNAQNKAGNTITYQCKNEKLANALRRVERLSDYYKMQFSVDEVSAYKVTVSLKDAAKVRRGPVFHATRPHQGDGGRDEPEDYRDRV